MRGYEVGTPQHPGEVRPGLRVCFERSPDNARVCHRVKDHEMPHRANGWEWGYTPCEATFQGSECELDCGHPGLHSTTIGWADGAAELTYAVEVCRKAWPSEQWRLTGEVYDMGNGERVYVYRKVGPGLIVTTGLSTVHFSRRTA